MTIYYEKHGVRIYHGSCLDILPHMPIHEMMFTDPPYGVDYKGGRFQQNRDALEGDSDAALYSKFLPLAIKVVDGPCYMWFTDTKVADVYGAVESNACEVSALIIWVKNHFAGTMSAQYKQAHEPCLYFKPKGSTLRWCGPTNEQTVWYMNREVANKMHPTQKPLELAVRAIRNHSAKSVLDPFMGSGTTLVAARRLGRIATGIEIEERYCEVAARRLDTMVVPVLGEGRVKARTRRLV